MRRYNVVIVWLLRVIVGGLFVFSGFVKVNDVRGFAIKLEKYWHAFDLEFGTEIFVEVFQPWTMEIATIFSISEVVLGLWLLLGIFRGTTTTLLFAQIVFFTFLTGWAAATRSVPDCGCFGDAFTIPPWSSFLKDVVLIVMSGILYILREDIRPILPRTKFVRPAVGLSVVLLVSGFTWYTLAYLPVVDFRACKVGADFREIIKLDPVKEKAALDGYISVKYTCEQDEFEGNTLFIFFKDLAHTPPSDIAEVNTLVKSLEGANIKVFGLTGTAPSQLPSLKKQLGLEFCVAPQDQDLAKTCVRSGKRPGFLLLKDGIIRGKWPMAAQPDKAELEGLL